MLANMHNDADNAEADDTASLEDGEMSAEDDEHAGASNHSSST